MVAKERVWLDCLEFSRRWSLASNSL